MKDQFEQTVILNSFSISLDDEQVLMHAFGHGPSTGNKYYAKPLWTWKHPVRPVACLCNGIPNCVSLLDDTHLSLSNGA